jgi:hypothetical protein
MGLFEQDKLPLVAQIEQVLAVQTIREALLMYPDRTVLRA